MSKRRLIGVLLGVVLVFSACAAAESQPPTDVVTRPRAESDGSVVSEEVESGVDGDQAASEATTVPSPGQVDLPDFEIVTLLPRDAIPAIFDPQFVTASEADSQYAPDELVLGVEFDGDARAYSIPFLSGHEIVNDIVAGRPIAVTW